MAPFQLLLSCGGFWGALSPSWPLAMVGTMLCTRCHALHEGLCFPRVQHAAEQQNQQVVVGSVGRACVLFEPFLFRDL